MDKEEDHPHASAIATCSRGCIDHVHCFFLWSGGNSFSTGSLPGLLISSYRSGEGGGWGGREVHAVFSPLPKSLMRLPC